MSKNVSKKDKINKKNKSIDKDEEFLKMNKKEKIFFVLLLINILMLLVVTIKLSTFNGVNNDLIVDASEDNINYAIINDLSKINLMNTDKLMIVAHPDDELLWGGAHLIEDDYLVVCVTCGVRQKRLVEFEEAMYSTNDNFLSLGYPDRTNGSVDDWNTVVDNIKRDLSTIINYKDWKLIVTHNPDGEYGHIHHRKINGYVKELSNFDVLYYFGKYYEKDELREIDSSSFVELDEKLAHKKEEILFDVYPSQKGAVKMHQHMIKYENWIKAGEWKD